MIVEKKLIEKIAENYWKEVGMKLPFVLYSKKYLNERSLNLAKVAKQKGVLARYAIKANPHSEIIQIFDRAGLHFDVCSEYEVYKLIGFGISPEKISYSSQQLPYNISDFLKTGVHVTATSIRQIKEFSKHFKKGQSMGVRINPGFGGGHNNRTNTGGMNSSFGIWHEYIPFIKNMVVNIDKIHIHVGSGADPKIWKSVVERSLEIMQMFPGVDVLNIGGGYKIKRYAGEKEADMSKILDVFKKEVDKFNKKHKRNLVLEIEPGTWLVGHAGILVSQVIDVVDTGKKGLKFVKLNTGMNDILRPSIYGAQHEISVLNSSKKSGKYVVVGHNCETGDILSPKKGNPEEVESRKLNEPNIGDMCVIEDVGAYVTSMNAKGYNSFPEIGEIFV